jgi:hypothetical protein
MWPRLDRSRSAVGPEDGQHPGTASAVGDDHGTGRHERRVGAGRGDDERVGDDRPLIEKPTATDPLTGSVGMTWLGIAVIVGATTPYEKSYSRRALKRMLEKAGLQVVAETAILFIPGWLRMLDLACHSWCRPLAAVTGALVRPFVFLDRHVPAVRRHGYLLATVVVKPERANGERV